ncbi:unnamed protein product (macronuclear) [Paramecium tetraurelia]|uniref:Serine aminopeptidase S33 domain-containing protein n=1 Tax=Paramecium tetraurelia TaxID=5888 RepID=A0D597_PARTE|nr:uncharacterized protein GSPATT00013661001 [Paramecium tetraurelia]CAK78214.1 unnamed protein product [Paramecium tetraurelia]|eukprot:XP_001445611.1 hypothetical protein (macronuclear) [Paramecium tetraurelia strain d4-2]
MNSGDIFGICFACLFVLLYVAILVYLHCFGKIYRLTFPSPTPMYTEKFFGEKLKYANVYNSQVNLKSDQLLNSYDLQRLRAIPYVYLKNKYSETSNYLLYFHGNAEDMQAASQFMEQLMKTINANIFVVEYPGYGVYGMQKNMNSNMIEEDALILYDHIKKTHKLLDNQIYVFGRSIGTGPAFYVASVRNTKGLIVMSSYKSFKAIVQDFCCGFGIVIAFLFCLPDFFNNQERSQQVKCPIVFIHGQLDKLIKPSHSNSLYINLPIIIQNKSQLFIRERMSHNDFDIDTDIAIPILDIFSELRYPKF